MKLALKQTCDAHLQFYISNIVAAPKKLKSASALNLNNTFFLTQYI